MPTPTLVFFSRRPGDLNINRTVHRTCEAYLEETGKFNDAEIVEWINNQLKWRVEDGLKTLVTSVTLDQVRLRIANLYRNDASIAKDGAWYYRRESVEAARHRHAWGIQRNQRAMHAPVRLQHRRRTLA